MYGWGFGVAIATGGSRRGWVPSNPLDAEGGGLNNSPFPFVFIHAIKILGTCLRELSDLSLWWCASRWGTDRLRPFHGQGPPVTSPSQKHREQGATDTRHASGAGPVAPQHRRPPPPPARAFSPQQSRRRQGAGPPGVRAIREANAASAALRLQLFDVVVLGVEAAEAAALTLPNGGCSAAESSLVRDMSASPLSCAASVVGSALPNKSRASSGTELDPRTDRPLLFVDGESYASRQGGSLSSPPVHPTRPATGLIRPPPVRADHAVLGPGAV